MKKYQCDLCGKQYNESEIEWNTFFCEECGANSDCLIECFKK